MAAVLGILLALGAVSGAVLLVAGRRADAAAAPLAVSVAAVQLVAGAAVALSTPALTVPALARVPITFAVDGLAAVAVTTVTVVFAAVVVFSTGEFGTGRARARYYGLLLVFASAMLATVTATDLLGLLVAWEIMGAVSYALIAYWWHEPSRGRSAAVAFLTTRTADVGMYLAAGAALAGGAAALELAALPGLAGAWRDVAVAGLLVAALGKSAQLPFSFWLSHAMAGPTPVSALLHSATMVAAGGYLLLRVQGALAATGWAAPVAAWAGASTALLLGVVAYTQRDTKQLLAASTCSQLGFVVLAAGVGATGGGALQFAAHAAAKSLLFLSVGAWTAVLGGGELGELRAAARRLPLLGTVFTVGMLAVGGLPPLAVWVAKDAVLAAALPASAALYAVALAASAVSAAYAARALVAVWSPAPSRNADTGRVPAAEWAPLPVLAAAAAGLGAVVLPPLAPWWHALLGEASPATPAAWETLLSGALAVGVLAVVVRAHVRRGRLADAAAPELWWPRHWLRLAWVAHGGVVVPVLGAARGLAAFDDRVLARAVDGTAAAGARLARRVDTRVETRVDGAVRAVAAGARTAGRWARRPQSGLLHQYYAQAVTALVLLAVLLVVLLSVLG